MLLKQFCKDVYITRKNEKQGNDSKKKNNTSIRWVCYQKYLELKGGPKESIYRSSNWNISPGAFKPLSQGPMKTSSVFIKHTIKVSVRCYWWCLGPWVEGGHTWRCPCISVVLETTYSLRIKRGALQGSKDETRELVGGTDEKRVYPMSGHWSSKQYFSQSIFIWTLAPSWN